MQHGHEGGLVQHAAFLGLRTDKDPRQVVRERVVPASAGGMRAEEAS
jgi:hypothetical protein